MVKKQKARLNIYIDPDNHERLKSTCEKMGISISFFIDQILTGMFMDDFDLPKVTEKYTSSILEKLFNELNKPNREKLNITLEEFKESIKKEVLDELEKHDK